MAIISLFRDFPRRNHQSWVLFSVSYIKTFHFLNFKVTAPKIPSSLRPKQGLRDPSLQILLLETLILPTRLPSKFTTPFLWACMKYFTASYPNFSSQQLYREGIHILETQGNQTLSSNFSKWISQSATRHSSRYNPGHQAPYYPFPSWFFQATLNQKACTVTLP